MGYYTDYTLSFKNATPKQAAALKIRLTDESGFGMEWWGDDTYYANAKWYYHQDDMRALSRDYPNVLFILHGAGENGEDDLWYEYYMGGKMQLAPGEVVYPQYDPYLLR